MSRVFEGPAVCTSGASLDPHSSLDTLVAQVTMQYNLCNEPWLKFSIGTVADRGLKASQWTAARLSSDVLYVETHRWVTKP